jgi:hypothetical protein
MILLATALVCASSSAGAQTVAELRAQLQQTRAQIAQAEAAGLDESILGTLREALAMAEEAIREMEAEQGAGHAATEPAAPAVAASYATRPNALEGHPACAGFNLSNYRQLGLEGGNDVQLKTMCAQAFEYYSMYLNAIRQGYSESDANRTYAAHEDSAKVASAFYENNRAN